MHLFVAMMAGTVCILLPPGGFPGQALVSLMERILEHGIDFEVVSEHPGRCVGEGGVAITATRGWDEEELAGATAYVVLDDASGTVAGAEPVLELLRRAARRRRVIGAVGAGVFVLAEAGVLEGRSAATILTASEERAGELGEELSGFRGIREGVHPAV